MKGMAFCDLCEMDREFCEHGLAERRQNAAATASGLLISPKGVAHFAGCPHKGDHQDYRRWADPRATRAGKRRKREQLRATGGQSPGQAATDRCRIWRQPRSVVTRPCAQGLPNLSRQMKTFTPSAGVALTYGLAACLPRP